MNGFCAISGTIQTQKIINTGAGEAGIIKLTDIQLEEQPSMMLRAVESHVVKHGCEHSKVILGQ